MELIVVSDNHGRIEPLKEIRNKYPQAGAYIHCGDSELPPESLDGYVSVMGNNDYFYDYPNQRILNIDGIKILVIHGHRFSFSNRISQIVALAIKNDCKIVCYGHTHVYDYRVVDGITIVNPGSLWRSRDGSKPSYAVIKISGNEISVIKKTIG